MSSRCRATHARNQKCYTCGAPIPSKRMDKRYCNWRHDPELLDARELADLEAQYPAPEIVTDAS